MRVILLGAALALSAPASAAVVGADAHGFEVRNSIEVPVSPAQALAAFGQIGAWWSKEHSYSGDASRLSLELRPGGCLCERLDDGGGVEYMHVAYYEPGKRIALIGALGPSLFEAVSGVMDVTAVRTGTGSRLTINYRAAGFARGNGTELALAVDEVLRQQAERLRVYAAKRGAKR